MVSYVGNTDVVAPLIGGNAPFLLYNQGEDYNRLFVTPQEEATAEWLASVVPSRRVIYADTYGALRLDQFTDLRRAVFSALAPQTIDHEAWVYASTTNVVRGRTWAVSNAGLPLAFSTSFLSTYFDTVYSTGTSEVFHR